MDSATTAALVEQQLACSVQDSLKLLLFDNARFMCERLVAMCGNEVRLRACPCLLAWVPRSALHSLQHTDRSHRHASVLQLCMHACVMGRDSHSTEALHSQGRREQQTQLRCNVPTSVRTVSEGAFASAHNFLQP